MANDLRNAIRTDLALLKPPLEGACLCGQVSFVASAAPFWSGNCHCRACQKLSGAPFVSAFAVPSGSFVIRGDTLAFHRSSDSGYRVTTTHCAQCGSRISAQSDGNTGLVNFFAATLRDPSAFRAIANVYLSEAASWIVPPKAYFNFQKMPVWPKSGE